MEVLTIIPFPHGLCDHVGWRGDVLEEQVEGLVCALARRYEHSAEVFDIEDLWSDISSMS